MNTPTEQKHGKFLEACDSVADDVYRLAHQQTANRDVATYLTRRVFDSTWKDLMTCYNSPKTMWGMRRLILRQAKVELADYTEAKKDRMKYYSKLWNLTLTQ